MAVAIEEMSEIVPSNNGLVLNIGMLTKERYHSMLTALEYVDSHRQKVLLDPVGCSASTFRLNAAKDLLATGKINILKVNPIEGLALCNQVQHGAYGVDSDGLDVNSKTNLATDLLAYYGQYNKHLVVVVTGQADIVASNEGVQVIRGGTAMQQRITGTGCMLNAVIMNAIIKKSSLHHGAIYGLKSMNLASERATSMLTNKQHTMTYKNLYLSSDRSSHDLLTVLSFLF